MSIVTIYKNLPSEQFNYLLHSVVLISDGEYTAVFTADLSEEEKEDLAQYIETTT